MDQIKVVCEETVFNDYLKIIKGAIFQTPEGGKTSVYSRCKVECGNSVTILLYNKTKDTVILVKQFRYPVWQQMALPKTPEIDQAGEYRLLEVIAGKIDEGERPQQTAVREVLEETGYAIKEDDLIYTGQGFASPGYCSERIYQFAAIVKNSDKKDAGGGVEGEYESIEVVELPYLEFRAFVENGSIKDMKTRLSFYEASSAGVFSGKKK